MKRVSIATRSPRTKRLLFVEEPFMMNKQYLSSKESILVKFKDSICNELCLKLWFGIDWYFGSHKQNSKQYFLIQFEKVTVHKSIAEHWTVFSNQILSSSILIRESIKLVIINMTYS